MAFTQDTINIPPHQRLSKELPGDRSELAEAWKVLEKYSGIPESEIDSHVVQIRDRAFKIFNYPCIGQWRFLNLYLTSTPRYAEVVSRVRSGEKLLDVGCCFGQILRKLAFDGCPAANLAGTDLRPEFVELGYELFRDKETFDALFVTGDIFGEGEDASRLERLDGQFDIIHAASFFHLFGWDDQVRVGERIVRFFRPDATAPLLLGRQVGSERPPSLAEYRASGARIYPHNVGTFQRLWDIIGENTGMQWVVAGKLTDLVMSGELNRTMLIFSVSKAG